MLSCTVCLSHKYLKTAAYTERDCITPELLPVEKRIDFKVLLLVLGALQDQALTEICW